MLIFNEFRFLDNALSIEKYYYYSYVYISWVYVGVFVVKCQTSGNHIHEH
jgi:hypothetical protein